MKLVIKQDFSYFHRGHDRVDYKAGDVIDTDDEEMAEVAISQKWAAAEELDDQSANGPTRNRQRNTTRH